MPSGDATRSSPDEVQHPPPIQCEACESALQNRDGHTLSFLLLDRLTVPVVGCDDHVTEFASVCGLTATDRTDVIDHPPAGGIRCPSCQLARYDIGHPVVSVQDGAVGILACQDHQAELVDRFHEGLDTQEQLTASLDTSR
ncbi:hypothetical protein [Haloplanus halobius]|uniref:hypothetical protein n=1 Tax=Haloplanus halobius TaxID=2934938 RepID=UPI00200F777B|nr:hypothetical protein [Haloplanus sp. XH21]